MTHKDCFSCRNWADLLAFNTGESLRRIWFRPSQRQSLFCKMVIKLVDREYASVRRGSYRFST